MTNRSIARSRGDLLNSVATVRFALLPVLAGAAMALAGNTFTPTRAFAADVVCTPDASGTAILSAAEACSGAGDKILYAVQAVDSTVTVNGVTITGAATTDAVSITNGVNALTLNVTGGGSITAVAAGGDAITAAGTTGSITISVGATPIAATGSGLAAGIFGGASTGAVSITAAGTVIDGVALDAASNGVGLWAFSSSTGALSITTTGAGSIGNFAGTTLDYGIVGESSGSGTVTINNAFQIGNSAAAGNGVDLVGITAQTGSSAATAISITNTGAIFVDNTGTFPNAGIFANGLGAGAVVVTNSGAIGTGDFGITANGGGNVSVSNSGAVAGDLGIRATTTGATATITVLGTTGSGVSGIFGDGIAALGGASTGLVTVGTSASRIAGNVSGSGGATNITAQGINARGTGNVSVFTGTGAISVTTNGGASWAIRATSDGAGSVVVDTQGALTGTGTTTGGILANTTSGAGTVTVNTAGSVTSVNGTAIDVRTVNGAANVAVSGAVSGGVGVGFDGGISAISTGTGKVTVTTSGAGTVTAGGGALGKGIGITTGTGGFALNVGSNVTSTGSNAIQTTGTTGTTGVNTISITGGTVAGAGTGFGTASVSMTTSSGGLTTLNTSAGATITSSSATAALQNADLVIIGTGGSVIINNSGTIRGRMDFTTIANPNNVVFNNNATGVWNTTGTSSFSGGIDSLNNSGLVSTNGTTSIGLGPLFGSFRNNATGRLFGAATSGASFTNVGASFFFNSGTIDLVDNQTNDVVSSTGFYQGVGTTPSLLIDANLGAGTQTGCTAALATVADCIAFASFSGTTTNITVNDVGGAGALNFTGVVVVDSVIPVNNNAFALTGANVTTSSLGAGIQKGFVQYQLLPDTANNNFVLVGLPGNSMILMGSLPAGMQNIWHDTADGWADRMAGVHQNLALNRNGDTPVAAQLGSGLGFWGKFAYSDMTRQTSQAATILGAGFDFDTSYTQATIGMQAGVDALVSNGPGGALILGVLAGYSSSVQRFDIDRTRGTFKTVSVGGYASFANAGGLSADLLVKDDITRVDLSVPGVSGLDEVDGNSLGVKATIAQRIGMGPDGFFFQPTGSIAYVRSTLKNISDPSATFDFADANSMRGTIGINVGADTVGTGGYTYRPLVFLGVGHEFEGKNRVEITSGTTTIDFRDKPMRTFGLASIGLNVFSQNGIAGFVKGDRLFSKNSNAWQIQAGLRLTN